MIDMPEGWHKINFMKIEIIVTGSYCNTWPQLIVEINDQTAFDGPVEGRQTIKLEYADLFEKGNKILLGMTNKSFGKNGKWDTKTLNNKIVHDKTIKVESLKLDDVECKKLFASKFYVKRTDKQPSYFPDIVTTEDTMNYNGYFFFNFDLPLYNYLINSKYKVDDKEENLSYFSNYSKVFHYDEEQKLINDIKDKLKIIDEKFSNKRSKIRNS
mgnify:FL=1